MSNDTKSKLEQQFSAARTEPLEGALEDERLHGNAGADRTSRLAEDRQLTESREVTEDDRLEMFRQNLFNDALPDLPPFPGYHLCWLTTGNPRDPIHRRLQLGYELIKAAEMPGGEYYSAKTGDFAGFVAVNEMVAAKLPDSLYQRFMQEAHHNAPAREEQKLVDAQDALKEQLAANKTALIEDEGNQELRRAPPARGVFT